MWLVKSAVISLQIELNAGSQKKCSYLVSFDGS